MMFIFETSECSFVSHLTFLFEHEPLVTPEQHDQHTGLNQLEACVDQGKQK